MKKKRRILAGILFTTVVCAVLGGCGTGVLLDEIPRDYGLFQETEEEQEESSAVRVVSLEEMLAGVQAEDGKEAEECFLMEEIFPYAYDSLSAPEQIWYQDMERLLGSFGEKTELSDACIGSFDVSEVDEAVDRIFRCVLNDHPELFYVDGYSCTKYMRGEVIVSMEFSGTYTMDPETALERREAIEESAEAVLAGIEMDAAEYDRVKYVYDTIICSTDYDLNAPDNQNIYSVFVNRRSVCQGYAKAAQYLLNRLGIESTLVLGTVDSGEGHAWNLVRVDGEYYYMDATWGDVSYQVEETAGDGDAGFDGQEMPGDPDSDSRQQGDRNLSMAEINYDYLNVTTEEILRTHSIGGVVPMPVCEAVAANYYVREGAYFTSYDREQMERLFANIFARGQRDVSIKCADGECYQEIAAALIDGQEIFSYLEDADVSVAYAKNEKQLSLTFWVTNK